MAALSSKRPKQVLRVIHRVLTVVPVPQEPIQINSTNTSSPLTKGHWVLPRMQHMIFWS